MKPPRQEHRLAPCRCKVHTADRSRLAALCNACTSKQHSVLRKLEASCLLGCDVQRLGNFALRPTKRGVAQSHTTAFGLSCVTFMTAGLLANLTCIQAELYEMESAMSVGEDPLWIVPYTTIAVEFQDLLDDYTTYLTVSCLLG